MKIKILIYKQLQYLIKLFVIGISKHWVFLSNQ